MAIEKVREYFKQYGMEDRILEMEQSSARWSWQHWLWRGTCENCEDPVI